jgi:non-ribosomal peptide synthase protein (TIGR01720 family)
VVPEASEGAELRDLLRAHLRRSLPEHMVPGQIVFLPALPLSANGKLDRRALPEPDAGDLFQEAYVPPRSEAEQRLAAIWSALLGIERVGVADNFFALGGDLIISIQMVSRAAREGLALTVRQVFEHQTLGALAQVAGHSAQVVAEQGLVRGEARLTPILHWFFDQAAVERHHFNQSVLLEVEAGFRAELLRPALDLLLQHHDALRLRFRRGEGWTQEISERENHQFVEIVDLSALAPADRRRALEEHAGALQRSLDLASGPLVRAAFYDHGKGAPGRLLLVIHHLAVDAVSWRILVDDLARVYAALLAKKPPALAPKTTSYRQWAARLRAHAGSKEARRLASFWTRLGAGASTALPVDHPRGMNRVGSVRELRVSLSEKETEKLLHDVPRGCGTQIDDALLAALALALRRWTGADRLLIDMERHGREPLFDDVDLSRTVGWFTSLFPLPLDLRRVQSPSRALASVAGQLRRIPDKGIAYGVLRYLSDDRGTVAALRSLPERTLSFNYLGQLDAALPSGPFRLAMESAGANHSERGVRSHLVDVVAMVRQRRLDAIWMYSAEIHERSTIAAVARSFLDELRGIVRDATSRSFAAEIDRASVLAEEGSAAQ